MAKRTNRVAWWLAAVLAVVVLGGIGLLGARLRPYWVAKYRGEEADLQGAVLIRAPLASADLSGACLRDADLACADLGGAFLYGANLQRTNLRGTTLKEAFLQTAVLSGTDLRGADLRGADFSLAAMVAVDLRDAIYDSDTAWPEDFNPKQHGAARVE